MFIECLKGLFGEVIVYWSVYNGVSLVFVFSDFIMDNGSVMFFDNENEKVCEWFCFWVFVLVVFIKCCVLLCFLRIKMIIVGVSVVVCVEFWMFLYFYVVCFYRSLSEVVW